MYCPQLSIVNDTCLSFPATFLGVRYRGGVSGAAVYPPDGGDDFVNSVMSSTRGVEIGMLVENVIAYWFRVVMQALIPLLKIVDDFFLSRFLTDLTEGLVTAVLGSNRLSAALAVEWELALATDNLWVQVYAFKEALGAAENETEVDDIDAEIPIQPVIVHGAGGLIAKGLALAFGRVGVAFESPQIERSPTAGFFGERPEAHQHNIINIFSGSTLLAMQEVKAKTNVVLPTWQKLWAPATEAETFCLTAAGCATDDRYDDLCDRLVGEPRFRAYFDSWGRPRDD